MRVLVACEFSGVVRDAFIRHGHDAVSCDLLPSESDYGPHYQGDVFDILDDGWDLMVAHPCCRVLANAGARWLKEPSNNETLVERWRALFEAAEFYKKIRGARVKKKAIENPIMHCHSKELIDVGPRWIVQPWWFGDPFFKATGFELFGLPPLVPTNKLTPPKKGTEEHKRWSASHREPPGKDRAKNRSRFFPGMADAMADQWG